MTDTTLRVAFAGPQVTLQDAGRPGFMRFGVPASGPMDRASFAAAQMVVGAGEAGGAAIEVSRGGLRLDCLTGAVTLAVAGGGFIVEHDGQTGGAWQVLTLRAGQTLTLRAGPWGSWTYVAFAGQMQGTVWLGSRATHAVSGQGGGSLTAGQVLTVTGARVLPAREGPVPCPVWARPRAVLRCVDGPQERFFDADARATLTGASYVVTDAADRMGVRLRGPALTPIGALSIPSEPILRGSVQVAGDGVATVLLSDHQTTGGYPKIATVLGCDIDGFVQCRPQDRVAFRRITPAEAVAATRAQAVRLATWLTTRARP